MLPGALLVKEMIQHAGAPKQNQDVETREALEHERPKVTSHIMDIKHDTEGDTCKTLANWAHPCIFQDGFDWGLKREGALPCKYQVKTNDRKAYGRKAYRARVSQDAGNDCYAKFLTHAQWYKTTGHTLGDDKKGDLVECLCFFGAISPN